MTMALGSLGAAHSATGTVDLTVTLRDGRVSVVPSSFPAGTVTVIVTNRGTVGHRLAIAGAELPRRTTRMLASGRSTTFTLNVTTGTFRLWDPARGPSTGATSVQAKGGSPTIQGTGPSGSSSSVIGNLGPGFDPAFNPENM